MIEPFLHGMAALGFVAVALFFLRFWQRAVDRFFLLFAVAFVVLAVERVVLGVIPSATEWLHYAYLLRLMAYALIVVAVLAKNRRT